MKKLELADKFESAGHYMQEHGYVKYAAHDSEGRVCWVGALCCSNPADCIDADIAARSMGFTGSNAAITWNDAPETTAEDVIGRFFSTAARLRAEAAAEADVALQVKADQFVESLKKELDSEMVLVVA